MQRDPHERTVEVAKAIARAEWPASRPILISGPSASTSRRQALPLEGLAGHRGLWALEDPKAVDVRATEHDVEADLGGVPFRGIVDRLDEEGDGLVVTDYKSGKAPSARFRRGRLDQVLLYAAAVEQATGEMPVHARLLYLGQRPVGIKVTREEIDSVVDKLAGTWAAINTACEPTSSNPERGPCVAGVPTSTGAPKAPRRSRSGRPRRTPTRRDAWRRRMDGQLITRRRSSGGGASTAIAASPAQ